MNTIHSPCNIETLLWFHTRANPIANEDAPAIKQTIDEFIRMGVIIRDEESGSGYKTTPLGRAWVVALCNVPPPIAVFADESGRIIKSV